MANKTKEAITLAGLEKKFPGEGRARYEAIAKAGGFGVQKDQSPDLDPNGLYDYDPAQGKAVIDEKKERAQEVEKLLKK